MTVKEKVKKIISIVFPKGNYRYYIMYFSSLIVLIIANVVFGFMIIFLNAGMIIHTDTFTATMPFPTSYRLGSTVFFIITNCLYWAAILWLVFAGHTVISVLFDIGYWILLMWKKLKNLLSKQPRQEAPNFPT